MDDFVKRLRSQFSIDQVRNNPTFVASTYEEERNEAADEIERLRIIEQTAADECGVCGWRMKLPDGCRNCEYEKQLDEIERLLMVLDAGGGRYWEGRCLELEAALDDMGQYISRADWFYLKPETRAALGEKKDAETPGL